MHYMLNHSEQMISQRFILPLYAVYLNLSILKTRHGTDQEQLGHSQISVTLDTYSHILPNMQRDAMAAMQELLAQ